MSDTYKKMKDDILKKINAGEVKMTPKIYFIARIILLIAVVFFIWITSAMLVSYILFSIRASGRLFLLGFGFRGLLVFLVTFPWLMLLIDALLLFVLEQLLQRFRIGYRSPIVYVFLGTIVLVLGSGLVIYTTPFHELLFREAREHHLPGFVGNFYTQVRRAPRENGVFRGIVSDINKNTFYIQPEMENESTSSEKVEVIAPPGVDISTLLNNGDTVFVAGTLVDNKIMAFGVRKIIAD